MSKMLGGLMTGDMPTPQAPTLPTALPKDMKVPTAAVPAPPAPSKSANSPVEVEKLFNYVNLSLEADKQLNSNYASAKPLSTVVRMFRLKDPEKFLAMPYNSFGDTAKEKEAMGEDLVSTKEIVLSPEKSYSSVEKISTEARYLGVVSLFIFPNVKRWKMVFPIISKNATTDVKLGFHRCNMSVIKGVPLQLTTTPESVAALAQTKVACP